MSYKKTPDYSGVEVNSEKRKLVINPADLLSLMDSFAFM